MEDISQVLSKVAQTYNLGTIASVEKILAGYLTVNYKLTTQDRVEYFLKQHRYTSEQDLKAITTAEEIFNSTDTPVIQSVTNNEGKPFSYLVEKYYTLYPFVYGMTISRSNLNSQHLNSMGKTLAKLHTIGSQTDHSLFRIRNTDLKKEKFWVRYEQIMPIINNVKSKSEFDLLAEKSLHIRKKLHETLPYFEENIILENDCIIHGDFHSSNLFFNEKGQITHIYDLEKTEYAPRLFELMRSIDYTCFHEGITDTAYMLAKTMLKAYDDIIPIKKDTLVKTIKAYIISKLNNLWIENEHYVKNNSRVDDLIRHVYLSLSYLEKNHDEFIITLADFSSG